MSQHASRKTVFLALLTVGTVTIVIGDSIVRRAHDDGSSEVDELLGVVAHVICFFGGMFGFFSSIRDGKHFRPGITIVIIDEMLEDGTVEITSHIDDAAATESNDLRFERVSQADGNFDIHHGLASDRIGIIVGHIDEPFQAAHFGDVVVACTVGSVLLHELFQVRGGEGLVDVADCDDGQVDARHCTIVCVRLVVVSGEMKM